MPLAFNADDGVLIPAPLQPGDRVRFVSPASPPARDRLMLGVRALESWGLQVDFGDHAFDVFGFLAGRDEDRLADLNAAFRDPQIRAIFATAGGKGAYRIADQLDFDAIRRDPKFVVGFSDITSLHLALWTHCRLQSVHGAPWGADLGDHTNTCLQRLLMTSEPTIIKARDNETTACLTTTGQARGRLIGGNLDIIGTSAGWLLPSLKGAILLIEAVNMGRGLVDRELTMLRKAGHLQGLAGVAVGQFTDFGSTGALTVIDLLREHLAHLEVPILGGLPLGHGSRPESARLGSMAHLDTARRELTLTA